MLRVHGSQNVHSNEQMYAIPVCSNEAWHFSHDAFIFNIRVTLGATTPAL